MAVLTILTRVENLVKHKGMRVPLTVLSFLFLCYVAIAAATILTTLTGLCFVAPWLLSLFAYCNLHRERNYLTDA
jgi:uncharacterized membrane protein